MKINILRELGGKLLPGLAEVRGLIKIGPHVIEPVGIEDDIGRGRVEMRSLDAIHGSPLRHARDILGDVGPVLAAVLRDMNQPVVAADPEDSFLFG